MRTPAAAIAWELQRRHRAGLAAVLATIVALGGIKLAILATHARFAFHDITFVLLVPLPLAATFLYLLAVFTYGLSGDIAARESMFPTRMLTLPVSSSALAGWPMLYGCLSMALLWFAMRTAGMFPRGVYIPRYWPALFAASVLAWTQALTWMPYRFRGMRIAIAIGLLTSIDVVVMTALETKARESTMLLLLAPLVPLAYVTARSAVGRARRGDEQWRTGNPACPSPEATRNRTGRIARPPFASAARAQLWLEWHQSGRSLPILVAIVLPFATSLLFVFRTAPAIVIEIVVVSLLMPPFLAIFVASSGIPPFVATRPAGDRALVVAKWQAALLSTLGAWAVVAVVLPTALLWADATEPIVNIARNVDGALGRPRAIVLGLLVLAILAGSTWKQLVQGLYLAMSGYDWAVKAMAFATLAFLTIGVLVLGWILDSRYRTVVAWNAIPWLMAALAALKLVLAAVVMRRGAALRLFTRRQLVAGAITWDTCVFVVYGALALILPAILVRRYFLLLAAMLIVPFVRLAATPLAVARSRHR